MAGKRTQHFGTVHQIPADSKTNRDLWRAPQAQPVQGDDHKDPRTECGEDYGGAKADRTECILPSRRGESDGPLGRQTAMEDLGGRAMAAGGQSAILP